MTTERHTDLMAGVEETQLREIFDRLHAVERQQADAGRSNDQRMAEIEKNAALDRKELATSLNTIKDMLTQIMSGETKNCLIHKAEIDALTIRMTSAENAMAIYKLEQAEVAKEQAEAIRHRYTLIWTALITGVVSLALKAVPWILSEIVKGAVK